MNDRENNDDFSEEPAEDFSDDEIIIHDADAEDEREAAEIERAVLEAGEAHSATASENDETQEGARDMAELVAIIEALIFVSEEPLTVKIIADVLK